MSVWFRVYDPSAIDTIPQQCSIAAPSARIVKGKEIIVAATHCLTYNGSNSQFGAISGFVNGLWRELWCWSRFNDALLRCRVEIFEVLATKQMVNPVSDSGLSHLSLKIISNVLILHLFDAFCVNAEAYCLLVHKT